MKLTIEGEPQEVMEWVKQFNKNFVELAKAAADQAAAYAAKADSAARNAEMAWAKIKELREGES